MHKLLSQLENSAEICSLEEWLLDRPSVARAIRMVGVNEKRDPLGNLKFSDIEVACVAGYSTGAEPPTLVYFWGENLGRISYSNLRTRELIQSLIRLVVTLGSIASSQPNMAAFCNESEAEISRLFSSHPGYLEDKHLYWLQCGDVLYVGLFSFSSDSKVYSATSIVDCIGFHNDYFRIKSPVWNSVPMSFLFDRVRRNPSLVSKLLLEPKCFNPFEEVPPGWFLWPWQRSLATAACEEAIQYSPIETTSLVFDLRKSTMALEQLRDEHVGLFSRFIKNVVKAAKSAILAQGGFFDKETGDGIVAHFCDFALPGLEMESTSVRAFKAARSLIGSVHSICDGFQRLLKMGVGGLGASVGLHSGKAVWICEKNLVSAYGESVIMASRLCAEAEIGAVFVSNYEFQKLLSRLPDEETVRFRRQGFTGKEYSERSQLYGYSMQVRP